MYIKKVANKLKFLPEYSVHVLHKSRPLLFYW